MKNLKLILPVFAIVLGLGIVFTQSAFKAKTPINLAYQYTGSTDEGVMEPSNWTPITYQPTPTECDELGDLVCIVQFTDEQFDNIADFLNNQTDAEAVNNSTYAKRHKEPINP